MADVNCQIGSRYIFGVGCEEPIFENIHEMQGNFRKRNLLKSEINYFTVTSSSDIMRLTQKRSSFGFSGFGLKVAASMDSYNKLHDTVNSVSVDLTDYRVHHYHYASASQLKLDFGEIDDFENDPEYFFDTHGFYYVIGITTGSTFDGVLNYGSSNSAALSDVSRSLSVGLNVGIFNVGGSYDY